MGKFLKLGRLNKIKIIIPILAFLLVSFIVASFRTDRSIPEIPQERLKLAEIIKADEKFPNVSNSVSEIQEVKDFKKLVEGNNQSKLELTVTDTPDIGKPYFTVKVYESFPDHDTVFNWYRVSVEGEISKQDLSASDKWDIVQAKTVSLIPNPTPKTVVVEKEVPAQCPFTQSKYDQDMKNKDDQIAQMQQAINFLKVEVGRLEGEVFFWRSRTNSLQYP